MVTALRKFHATTRLHGRYYNTSSRRPVLKAIHTQMNSTGRAPRLDIVFAQHKIQPYIHDAIVSVVHRNTTTHFHIFVKNHCQLRPNKIIQRWNLARTWRGDILVMRKGVSHDLVNLRGGDGALADFAVKKFVERVGQKTPFHIPRGLVFYK